MYIDIFGNPARIDSVVIEIERFSMRPYVAFYRGKKIPVMAESSYQAQLKAAQIFKAKKSYEVTVVLADVEVTLV